MKNIIIFFVLLACTLNGADYLPLEVSVFQVKSDHIEDHFPTFSFKLDNGRKKDKYLLSLKNIQGKEEILHSDLRVSPSGVLIERDGTPFTLCPLSMGLGEPLLLTCKSRYESARYLFIPRPFACFSNGYTLSLELKDPENKTFSMFAKGFEPGEKIVFYSKSGDKAIHQELVASPSGEINGTLSHSHSNKGGEAYLEISAKNGKLTLNYPWGLEYEREIRKNREREKKTFLTLSNH